MNESGSGARLGCLLVTAVMVAACGTAPSGSPGVSAGGSAPGGSAPAASTGSGGPASASPAASGAQRGGTLRVVVPAAAGTGLDGSAGLRDQPAMFLDPQLDGYGPSSWSGALELWRCCLTRTLYSYNGLPTENGGGEVRPDLATGLPEVSPDGLTWTIHIKPGLHYAPPLASVEITAHDIVRALHRLYSPAVQKVTPWYLGDDTIQGTRPYTAGKVTSISGLEVPDDHTLIIRLVQPQGDLAAWLAYPSTGPIAPDPAHPEAAFGVAQGADHGYGRTLVSSGPYMVDGAASTDLSAQRKAPSGMAPGRVTLVRNPSWDPATDGLRPAYPDRIEIVAVASVADAVAAMDRGAADLVWPQYGPVPSVPSDVFAGFQGDQARGTVHLDAGPLVRNVVMDLAVPPFDDLHVRKALNLAVDKARLVELQGGPVAATPARHLAPDAYENGRLLDYAPYRTEGDRGDLEEARREMAKATTYDTNGDGRCDAAACRHLLAITRDPYAAVSRAFAEDAAAIGLDIEVKVLESNEFLKVAQDPKARVPMAIGIAYGVGPVTASGIMSGFDSRFAFYEWQGALYGNTTMIGATPEQLGKWGYEVKSVPNVDARVEACVPKTGADQYQCWAALDQYLMEYVVPWVPYSQDRYAAISSPRVIHYGFDELAGTTALDQVALAP